LSQDELKFFSQMKKVLGMEIKTENVFNALENIDEDGDKLISKDEIIAFCNKNPDALEVLGVSSVKELYASAVSIQRAPSLRSAASCITLSSPVSEC
jgi:hypothetical protein